VSSPTPPLLAGRHIVAALSLWLLVGGLLLLQFWPSLPRNGHEVALVLVIGPPAYGLLELAGSWLLSKRHGKALSTRRLSPLRVLVALLVAATWLAAAWWFSARLLDVRVTALKAGDHVLLPARTPHTVNDFSQAALGLAIHLHP